MTPRQVVEQLLAGITAERWHEAADLYSDDAVVAQPLALPHPSTVRGKAESAAHFERAAGGPLELVADHIEIHDTADPELVIARYEYRARNRATGASAIVANVQIVRVRHGLIVRSEDFHDHAILGAVTGRLSEVVDAAALRVQTDTEPSR